jgi:hypothetical protein
LILGIWVVLLFRIGILGSLFKPTKILKYSEEQAFSNKTWLILAIAVFSVLSMLYLCLILVLGGQGVKELETSIVGQRNFSIVMSFLFSPIFLILILEAWLTLSSYFGLHYLLHRLEVSIDQNHRIKRFTVTVIQFVGVLTCLIGFGWWSYLGITDQDRIDLIRNFSFDVLSPTTVLLTGGLVILLFISLSKILAIEENTKQHAHIAGRMTILLLSTLILLGLIGGILSILFHYDRSQWNNL